MEACMPRQESTEAISVTRECEPRQINRERRALLGAGAALILGMALRPFRAGAQGRLRIGIIGSGHIGGTVGTLWVKAGLPVMFSSRNPDELKELVAGLGEAAKA